MSLLESTAAQRTVVPRSRLTPAVRRDVLIDRFAWNVSQGMVADPPEADLERIALEVDSATTLFRARGWLDDPSSFHREPEPPTVRSKRRSAAATRFTSLTWLSHYEPDDREPGRARWLGYSNNRIARAAIFRHSGKERPWLICVHGWGMGRPGIDARAFRAIHLHRRLGMNVALPVLPLHGRRRPAGVTGMAPFPGVDMLDNVHGFAQAVSDIRQLVSWIRERSSAPIGIMGMSLGGYTAALTAAIDDRLSCAIALIPAVDLAAIFEGIAVERFDGSIDDHLLDGAADVLSVVSPLRLQPLVPRRHRMIVAATLDQFTRASTQAAALWEHWDRPEIHWFHGSHVSLMWAAGVQEKLDDSLRHFGLAKPLVSRVD